MATYRKESTEKESSLSPWRIFQKLAFAATGTVASLVDLKGSHSTCPLGSLTVVPLYTPLDNIQWKRAPINLCAVWGTSEGRLATEGPFSTSRRPFRTRTWNISRTSICVAETHPVPASHTCTRDPGIPGTRYTRVSRPNTCVRARPENNFDKQIIASSSAPCDIADRCTLCRLTGVLVRQPPSSSPRKPRISE
jgi:hypothetical protein